MKKAIIILLCIIICISCFAPTKHTREHKDMDISIFNTDLVLDRETTNFSSFSEGDSKKQLRSDVEVSLFYAALNDLSESESETYYVPERPDNYKEINGSADMFSDGNSQEEMANIVDYLNGSLSVENDIPYTYAELAIAALSDSKPQNKPVNKIEKTVKEYCPEIVCWGDSLTNGTGGFGNGYPEVLRRCINSYILKDNPYGTVYDNVINMGFSGEDAVTIAVRSGSVRLLTSEDITIPADDTRIEIKFESAAAKIVTPLHTCKVFINGVPGTIYSKNAKRITKESNVFYFRRNLREETYPEEVKVSKGTQIVFESSLRYRSSIPIIFMGQNGGYDTNEELIAFQKAMIDHQTFDTQKYIIVGLHTGTLAERESLENAMEQTYGAHYINLREYMSGQALEDAGITPSAEDFSYMSKGMTPPCLLYDSVHFNETGYELLGNLIFERMVYLGYFNEVSKVVNESMDDTDISEDEISGDNVETYDYTYTLPINKVMTIRVPVEGCEEGMDKSRVQVVAKSDSETVNRFKVCDGYVVVHIYAQKQKSTSLKVYLDGDEACKCRLKVM